METGNSSKKMKSGRHLPPLNNNSGNKSSSLFGKFDSVNPAEGISIDEITKYTGQDGSKSQESRFKKESGKNSGSITPLKRNKVVPSKSNRVEKKGDQAIDFLANIFGGGASEERQNLNQNRRSNGQGVEVRIQNRLTKSDSEEVMSEIIDDEEYYEDGVEDNEETFKYFEMFMQYQEWLRDKKGKKFLKKKGSGGPRKRIKKKNKKGYKQLGGDGDSGSMRAPALPPIDPNFFNSLLGLNGNKSGKKPVVTENVGNFLKKKHKSDLFVKTLAKKFNALGQVDQIYITRNDYLTKVLVSEEQDKDALEAIQYTKKILEGMKRNFTNIAFEGGGVKAFAYSGVIYFLDKYDLRKDIKNVIGTSAGGIAALLFALDLPTTTLIEELMKLDFKKFADGSLIPFSSAYNLIKKLGIYKGETIIKFVENLLERYGLHKNMTFNQLYLKKGINLVITGTDIETMKGVYFHKDNPDFPDMQVKHAIRITTSLPIAYQAYPYKPNTGIDAKERKFVDGVLFRNLPIDFWDTYNENGRLIKKNYNTLGVLVSSLEEMEDRVKFNNANLMKYMANIVSSLTGKVSQAKFEDEKVDGRWERIIEINTGSISVLKFDLTNEELGFMFKSGYEAAANYFGMQISADLKFVKNFRTLTEQQINKLKMNENDRQKLLKMKRIQEKELTCHDRYLYWVHYFINKVANIV